MTSPSPHRWIPAVASLMVTLVAAMPSNASAPGQYLSGPASGDALDIALGYLTGHRQELGLTAQDFEDHVVSDRYVSKHTGVTHVYLQQRLGGVEVWNGLLNVNVTRDGRILALGNRWVGDLAGVVVDRAPALQPEQAVARAARHLGLEITEPLTQVDNLGGPALSIVLTGGGISQDDIPLRLVYQRLDNGHVRLAWNVVLRLFNGANWWNVRVDAVTGEVLDKNDWIAADSYRAVPIPFNDPAAQAPSIINNPADGTASPFGWHDTNGAAGPEFTDTRGNNVNAQEDTDANNTGGTRPSGGGTNDYDFAFDPGQAPTAGTNQSAAIVNLFYWNNIIHDVMHQYGFDEPGGNFQANNYGNGGAQNDPVAADAQDGSGTNNANFATPPDGSPPRMQMFQWTYPFPNFLTVNTPPVIAGDYVASGSNFGPAATVGGTTANMQYVVDTGGVSVNDGCEALVGFTAGRIALIDRGNCNFNVKVGNAQAAGAVAAVIVNLTSDIPTTLGGTDGTITIPSGMIGNATGNLIKAQLGGGVNATLRNQGVAIPPNRDSDFDGNVIVHEYGHGISNRLTGGPANSGCLGTQEQMGEGWSDWYGLAFTAQAADTANQARGIATYSSFQASNGPGIRRFPYSRNLAVNPDTFSTISAAGVTVPHGVGSVWAAIIWDVYWDLVDRYGFNPDIYDGFCSGGNNRAIQLITDGLKIQPCGPGFVDGRNAILAAELALTGGADRCLLWRAFARRGLGTGASSGNVNAIGDEVQSFAIPPECVFEDLFSDSFECGDTSAWSATVP